MELVKAIAENKRQAKKKPFCCWLKTSTIDKLGTMAMQNGVNKSFLAGELLEVAMNLNLDKTHTTRETIKAQAKKKLLSVYFPKTIKENDPRFKTLKPEDFPKAKGFKKIVPAKKKRPQIKGVKK